MSLGIPQDFKRYFSVRGSSVIGEDESGHQPIHLRALLIGAFFSFFLSVAANYADIIIRGSYLSLHFSTTGAILLLLVLVGGLCWVVGHSSRRCPASSCCVHSIGLLLMFLVSLVVLMPARLGQVIALPEHITVGNWSGSIWRSP